MAGERITFEVPAEFSDEEKWLKFFTMKSAIVFVVSGTVGVGIAKLSGLFGCMPVGVITGMALVAVCTGITMIHLPAESYLKGGGQTLDVILARRFVRKYSRYIYIRGYGAYRNEEGM